MKIYIKNSWPYRYVFISDGNTTIDNGILDEEEQIKLAEQFIDAAYSLLQGHSDTVSNKLADILNEYF